MSAKAKMRAVAVYRANGRTFVRPYNRKRKEGKGKEKERKGAAPSRVDGGATPRIRQAAAARAGPGAEVEHCKAV